MVVDRQSNLGNKTLFQMLECSTEFMSKEVTGALLGDGSYVFKTGAGTGYRLEATSSCPQFRFVQYGGVQRQLRFQPISSKQSQFPVSPHTVWQLTVWQLRI